MPDKGEDISLEGNKTIGMNTGYKPHVLDTPEYHLRREALRLAVQQNTGTTMTPMKIIEEAERYRAYLETGR